jgi:hypothetical protein
MAVTGSTATKRTFSQPNLAGSVRPPCRLERIENRFAASWMRFAEAVMPLMALSPASGPW